MSFELAWRTPVAWAEAALAEPLVLLSDHAHCELGAAAAAQGWIARFAERTSLVERLGALAVEELRHFRRVHRLLVELGGVLEPPRKNAYVEDLHRARGEEVLLDRLLIGALVERRSLERFELLAEHADGQLKTLYAELAPSERGHATLFLELARDACGAERSAERFEELRLHEGRVARAQAPAPRVHAGPPASEEAEVAGSRHDAVLAEDSSR